MIKICATTASLLCGLAGIYFLYNSFLSFDKFNQVFYFGLGLYCLGKAFFVGPMLFMLSIRLSEQKERAD